MMKWDEISRRLRNGTSVQILADLDGVPYKTMYNRIKYYEKRDGKRYMPESTPRKTKGATGPEEIRDSAADPEEVKPVIIPEFLTKPLNIPEDVQSLPVIPEAIRKEIREKIAYCTMKAEEYIALAKGWKRILEQTETEGKT